ncbi:DMT family transporter [Zavarzinia sp. CC-PAN008]|uniref:DMT family transporter n=1 Tax=Zavarzinia sp. CC-PAN008 TaxID=3243332 RepID=UPI003F745FA4
MATATESEPSVTERSHARRQVLAGVLLCFVAFFFYPMQDALVKWLVERYSPVQLLFVRAAVIALALLALKGPAMLRQLAHSPVRRELGLYTILMVIAWLMFFTAMRELPLGEAVTLYFSAPVLVVVLAIPLLGEKVTGSGWIPVGLGFAGVLVACRPGMGGALFPVAMAVGAAVVFAFCVIIVRRIGPHTTSSLQILAGCLGFVILFGPVQPLVWRTPDLVDAGLFLGMALSWGCAQFLFFEAFRRAPASVIAPIEFTGLAWAFIFGFVVWGDRPDALVLLGAAMIVASGLLILHREWQASRA